MSSVFEGKDDSTGSYTGERCLLTDALLCVDLPLPLSISSVLDGSDGNGDSTGPGDGDLRVSLSRLEVCREGGSFCLE